MKTRMSLIFAALVVILISMIWVVRDRGASSDVAVAPAMSAPTITPIPTIAIESVGPTTAPAQAAVVTTPAAVEVSATPAAPVVEVPKTKSPPLVQVAKDGTINYIARDGDTVSELAVAMLGSDSKANRDAVIAANESLQNNPDRVLVGKTYSIVPVADETADATVDAPATTDSPAKDAPAKEVAPAQSETKTPTASADQAADSAPKLKYTAQPGDSVAVLAASLLGGDTKENRDAVISSNASLQRDPDHLVAGKNYTIVATNGLAAAPNAAPVMAASADLDADDAARMSVGRVLRYVAQPGDTVSKLAMALLGSDTKANRDAIINNNRSLKLNPDHLVAGKTYWIAAPDPVADTTTP